MDSGTLCFARSSPTEKLAIVRASMRLGSRSSPLWMTTNGAAKELSGSAQQLLRGRVRDEPGVVAHSRTQPETAGPDVPEELPWRLQLLVVVDEEGAAGDGIDRTLIEEQPADRRRHVDRVRVPERDEAAHAVRLGQVEPHVPAVVPAGRERDREDDAGVLELVLVGGKSARRHQKSTSRRSLPPTACCAPTVYAFCRSERLRRTPPPSSARVLHRRGHEVAASGEEPNRMFSYSGVTNDAVVGRAEARCASR